LIVSRAPVRITLGGGGTDLESYYSKHGGFLIAAAVDKYVFISANRRFYDSIRLSYSQTEITSSLDEIKHPIFREAMRFLNIDSGIELVSIADVPANCGLGTSSSFTVSLLNALHAYKKEFVSQKQLAEEACHIEISVLGQPIGKQDQYIAALGGVTCLTFEKNGEVITEPLRISEEALDLLTSNIQFFHTGIERRAADILKEQDSKSSADDPDITENLHQVKEIGLETRAALEKGDVDRFGELLNVHWEIKKKRSGRMTDPFIDECYELARRTGALGGKLVGAGGGGFLMFYCNNGIKPKLYQTMCQTGLKPASFHIDFHGATVLINI
jgi:D-glycero-alpha-D-manno-heptose-7-phosphate kinase